MYSVENIGDLGRRDVVVNIARMTLLYHTVMIVKSSFRDLAYRASPRMYKARCFSGTLDKNSSSLC